MDDRINEIFKAPPEETQIYKNIVDCAHNSVLIAEYGTRRLIFANRVFKTLIGVPEDKDITGEVLTKLISPEDKMFSDEEIRNFSMDSFSEADLVTSHGHYLHAWGKAINWGGLNAYLCYISDLSDVIATQRELETSKKMLGLAMSSAKVLVWRYDYRTQTITDTSYLGEKFGFPKVIENLPDSIINAGYIDPHSVGDFRRLYYGAANEEPVEYDIKSLDINSAAPAWHHQILTPVFDDDGNYVETIGTSIDVTNQKEKEKNYEEQLRIKRLQGKDSIATLHYNLTKNIVTNAESKHPILEEIMNSGSADAVLARISLHTKDAEEENLFSEIKDCKTAIKTFESGKDYIRVRHHLGDVDANWYESDFSILQNPYTEDIEAVSTLRDISELIRAEEIVDTIMKIDYDSISTMNVKSGVYTPFVFGNVRDFEKIPHEFSDDAVGIRQYLEKYCTGRNKAKILEATEPENILKVLDKSSLLVLTIPLKINDVITYKRALYSYLDSSKSMVLCAVQDLTEEYEQEEKQKRELASALSAAKSANQAKTEFFSRMSHDMRTPMNGILGLAELSVDEKNMDVLKENILSIKSAGSYLLRLINDTLDFQRIESGKMQLNLEVVRAYKVIDNVINIIGPAADEKGIDFICDVETVDLNRYLRIDPVRMEQIFINILSNAVKYTNPGGNVKFAVRLLEREKTKSHVEIKIKDTGVGMSEDFLKNKLFEPFSQEHNEVSNKYAGTGLGLPIVKSLVSMMNGEIHAKSELGKGSEFTIRLCVELVEDDLAQSEQARGENNEKTLEESLKGKKVLLVEDNALNATIAKKLLSKVECITTWVENGKKGFDMFASSKPGDFDTILMDIRMPVMDGLEAAKAIRALEREDAKTIPIIAMTANAYEEDIRQTEAAGMNCHLSKPIDPHKMFEAIAKYSEK